MGSSAEMRFQQGSTRGFQSTKGFQQGVPAGFQHPSVTMFLCNSAHMPPRSTGSGLPRLPWAFRAMPAPTKIRTEGLPSTVSALALDNEWRREFLDLVEQPEKLCGRIPEGEPQSLPAWAQLGLDETPL